MDNFYVSTTSPTECPVFSFTKVGNSNGRLHGPVGYFK